jgi:hypothetical protein
MTNAEAIEILKKIIQPFLCVSGKKCWEAIDMAIAALEEQAQEKPLTNADRIRAMTDEELAELIADGCCRNIDCPDEFYMEDGLNCHGCWLDWLKQEVSDNG